MTEGRGDERAGMLLLVCRANVCRSPLAEEFLRGAFEGRGWLSDLTVASAGLETAGGSSMCGLAGRALGEPAMTFAAAHRSRPVDEQLVASAALVLTMETDYRAAMARRFARTQGRVYTLVEAAWLLAAAEKRALREERRAPGDLGELVELLRSMRGFAPLPVPGRRRRFWHQRRTPEPFTIEDGHTRSEREHQIAVRAVLQAAQTFADSVVRVTGSPTAR